MDEGYHCTCKLGYKGDRCQKKALCYPNPCKNGATCIDRDDREYECSCALGFKGELCQVLSECKNAPCVNGGTCIEMAVGYRCACFKGFAGKNCEVTLCSPNPCANDGKCSVLGDHYSCECPRHYIGKHCEGCRSDLAMAKACACIIWVFMSCLALSGIHGKWLEPRASNKSKTTTEIHRKRLKEAVKVKNVSNINNAKQDGDTTRQVLHDKTKNTTNNVLKRTMKEGTGISLKNTVHLPSFRLPLKLLRLKTANPLVRSRLTSLRSSTFKPIHIYGSVPFKTFLSALSKSNSQEAAVPTPALQSAVPQVAQTSSNVPMASQLSQDKALQARQFLSPGPMPLPVGPQGGMPMFLGGPEGGFNGAPLEGPMPILPPEEMASFYGYPVGYQDHHSVHHHLHRKVFTRAKCFPNPCQNGGSCTAFSTSYECSCPVGFKGHSCEERNQCVPNPCKNGGNCYDDEDNYKCTCVRGYTGYNCEEISKCLPNPCKNGATCLETGESYQCECPEHFNGAHCEVRDYCGQENPCMNGGHCHNKESGYECKCEHGYRGHDCAEFDVCNENPCDNGGVCRNIEGGQFTCKCHDGYRGITCEEKIPPCDLDPCKNGGTCMDETDRYVCHCPEHWRGKHCDDPVHTPCSDNPCENGGKCMALDYGDYKCQCPHDFGGMHCEVQAVPECYSCHDHATCKDSKCECVDGYTGNGHYCEVLSRCHPNPCYNGGVCHDHASEYECICADGFMGKTCQEPKPCLASPCLNGGTCVDRIGTSCFGGMPCTNHGYECTCPIDFRGPNCEYASFCHPNPCENGGHCVSETTTYICQCPIRYSGQKCEVDKCNCDVNAKCDKGKCVCNPGYVGQGTKDTCKPIVQPTNKPPVGLSPSRPTIPSGLHPGLSPTQPVGLSPSHKIPPLNKCIPSPCQNGGTCIPIGTVDFTCKCPPQFTGKLCTDSAKSYCHPSPCLNGGICVENPTGYKCQCVGHFRGTNCQVDDCDRCDIRAICVKGKCQCRVGYTGDGYQCTKIKKCGGCSPHATCKISKCVCNMGFIGDGTTCKPMGCSDCPSNSKCVYGICVCLPGFFFDGKNCAGHRNAMDEILAINFKTRGGFVRKNILKRETAEDNIIQANNAQETSDDLLEGDVILDPRTMPEDKEMYELQQKKKNETEVGIKRQGTRNLKWLWHEKKVPYEISRSLFQAQFTILGAIKTFNSKTCVKFTPRKRDDKNYVLFDKRQGCYSRIGRSYARPGPQVISIGDHCDVESIIVHEMLHAVGFFHEQSRPDRQKHIKIHWENVRPGFENEFIQYNHGQIDNLNINYNYKSLMHYGSDAFSKSPGLDTISAIGVPGKLELGNSEMSPLDIIELDALYRCESNKLNEWTAWSSYSPCDPRTCYKSKQRFCYGKTPTSCGGNPNRYGVESKYVKCSSSECPIKRDGGWGEWTPWSACTRSCNEGTRIRRRKCDNPTPENGGKQCKGASRYAIICVQPRCRLDDDDTDFRNGRLGIWDNDIYDTPGLDWIIGKGETPTERTGPHGDHTTKKGFFLYVESTGRRENDVARLISKTLQPRTNQSKQCFNFFYHMYGQSIGSLTVRLAPEGREQKILFTKTGHQSAKWKSAKVTLKTSTPYQLIFEAVLGKPPYSDIAIDDVFIDDDDCECRDKYMVCKYWKQRGYCKTGFQYMYLFCPRSCDFCGCENNPRVNCKFWSMKECKKNPVWMEANCPVTCQVCACYDKSIWCNFWKFLGECEKNPSYMKVNCRKTCGICT